MHNYLNYICIHVAAPILLYAYIRLYDIAGGGAICTDDEEKAKMFKKLRKHGEGEMLGYNSKMLLMNAEFINFRLNKMKEWQQKRQEIAKMYDEQLQE